MGESGVFRQAEGKLPFSTQTQLILQYGYCQELV